MQARTFYLTVNAKDVDGDSYTVAEIRITETADGRIDVSTQSNSALDERYDATISTKPGLPL